LALWKKLWLPRTSWLLLWTLALLGFSGAAMWDLKAGNVSTFEQISLWTGLAFFEKRRFGWFAFFVALAATFKILLAVFLVLLLLPQVRTPRALFSGLLGALGLAALVGLPFLFHPHLLPSYASNLAGSKAPAVVNPSSLGLIAFALGAIPDLSFHSGGIAWGVWLAYVVALVGLSRPLLAKACAGQPLRFSILVFVLLYALVAPRLMVYSYLLVIVPVLALVEPLLQSASAARAVFIAALCLSGASRLQGNAGTAAAAAIPYLLLLSTWFLLVWCHSRPGTVQARAEAG
jgi:hypothetical protein